MYTQLGPKGIIDEDSRRKCSWLGNSTGKGQIRQGLQKEEVHRRKGKAIMPEAWHDLEDSKQEGKLEDAADD
jgi:hypothetical protein